MDLRRALLVLRRWWLLLLAGTLLAAAAAYAVSKALPRVYEATALLNVNPGLGTPGGGGDFNEMQAAWAQAQDDARLIHTADVAQAAINRVGGHLRHAVDAGTLLNDTRAQAAPQSLIVSVIVRAPDPNDAAMLANAMTNVFIARDAASRTSALVRSLDRIEAQIRSYSADESSANSLNEQLLRAGPLTPAQQKLSGVLFQRISIDQGELAQLRQTSEDIQLRLSGAGSTLALAQPATATPAPVSPRTAINVLVAAILTLLALLGIALLLDFFDDRPRTAGAVAAALDLPLLGTISPLPRGSSALVMLEEPASAQADEYRGLRVNLGPAAGAGSAAAAAHVLVVTGVHAGDGATTVAANVAAVAARGGERVILVDANLRRPALHALFGLSEQAGLTAALRDDADPVTLLRESGLPHLRVLVAGHAPAEAIDLLGSTRMRNVLAALQAAGDLVVVDTAPAESADAALLAALAGATLLVARLRDARSAALVTAGRRLRLSGAHLAGVAVTLFGTAPATTRRSRQHAGVPDVAEATPAGRTDLRSAK